MFKQLPLAALALTLAAGASLPALADDDERCAGAPRDQWMSEDEARAKVTGLGYDVRKIEADDSCYEAYAIDKDGRRVEVYLHPVSGEVVKTEVDD